MQRLQQLLFFVILAGILIGCGQPAADPNAADNKKNVGKPSLQGGGASAGAVE
ncbi:MAG: hypothetical protein HZC36_01940 [Armatimonadetes bacterium]|nr:hypothetical protein [Armatimonadota bacterium]